MRRVLINLFALLYVAAGFKLCPEQKHLEEAINKCHGKLPALREKSEQLTYVTSMYEKQCVEKLAPGASDAEIQRMRCVDQHFDKQFYRCWSSVLDDDQLLKQAM